MVIAYAKILEFLLKNLEHIIKAVLLLVILFMGKGWWDSDTDATQWEHNYSTLETTTTKYINDLGDSVTSVNTRYLTVSELKDSKDKELQDLLGRFGKIKKDNHLLNIKLNTKQNFTTVTEYVYEDNPYGSDIELISTTYGSSATGALRETETETFPTEIEHYKSDVIDLIRTKAHDSDSSKYLINYHPNLYVQIGWYKLGKWKLKNLIKWRPKVWKTDITSNDDSMSIDSIQSVYTGKFNDL